MGITYHEMGPNIIQTKYETIMQSMPLQLWFSPWFSGFHPCDFPLWKSFLQERTLLFRECMQIFLHLRIAHDTSTFPKNIIEVVFSYIKKIYYHERILHKHFKEMSWPSSNPYPIYFGLAMWRGKTINGVFSPFVSSHNKCCSFSLVVMVRQKRPLLRGIP